MEALASSLSGQGAIIVSGAAHGTDMAAHRGALAVGGGTIAILPMGIPVGGLDRLSPLLDTLTDPALLLMVAPFALSQIISRTTPVIRNRLIATLAHAVVVGEAGPQSGTLHCVRFARELGIPIFLLRDPHIPRDPDLNAIHEGLIRQGASPFSVDDCWGTELAARIVRVARLDQDQRRAAERAQLSLFGELGE
jgi:DNA processing protein